jgi:hypothetical protein
LAQIDSNAFSESSLQSIVIPSSVEILGSSCFSRCQSLSSISFESNSRLTRIDSTAFSSSSLQSIIIPPSDDLTAIPFKRETKWSMVQKFVLRQCSAHASASTIIEASKPAFWVLVLLVFGFLFVALRMRVALTSLRDRITANTQTRDKSENRMERKRMIL